MMVFLNPVIYLLSYSSGKLISISINENREHREKVPTYIHSALNSYCVDLLYTKIYINLLQMAGVQATIPFRSRKKVYVDDEDIVSNENKDILNIRKPSVRKLKRHNTEHDLKKNVDEGNLAQVHYYLSLRNCYLKPHPIPIGNL